MSTRSLTRIDVCAIAAALLLCATVAFAADKKQEMYDQAVKAGSAGKVEEAARLFCELAKLDAKYKDASQMCAAVSHEAELERKKSDDRFAEGMKAFQEGRFDDAEQKFKNVRAGTHMDEAAQYLARIPAAKNEKLAADAEGAKFDQGADAYRRSDFPAARTALAQIKGKRASEAQTILDNIKRYEDAMTAGDAAAAAHDSAKAAASYNQALAIKGDGPGDPRGKLSRVQTASTPPAGQPATGPGGKPAPPTVAAVKEPKAVDVSKLLREAVAAHARGNYGEASGKYLAVLANDPNNAVAKQGLSVVSALGGRGSAGSEADAMLVRAIREFYQGFYDESETHIKDYMNANGSRTGLSQFYLGAIKLTRYYLAGEPPSDKKLLNDAKTYFQMARGIAGFTPPDQKVISPKILKIYGGSSQ